MRNLTPKQIKLIEKTFKCKSKYSIGDIDIWFHKIDGGELVVWYAVLEGVFHYGGTDNFLSNYTPEEFFKLMKMLIFV
jgi:hypothetical protein